jgi:hypothetical protein
VKVDDQVEPRGPQPGSQTRFTQTSRFETSEQRDTVLPTVEQGANFTYSRLDSVLARLVSGKSKES